MDTPSFYRPRCRPPLRSWCCFVLACVPWLVTAGRLGAGEEPPPWRAALAADAATPAFADACFDDFPLQSALPTPDELHRWFAQVPGQGLAVRPTRTEAGPCAELEGLARLKMPWRAEVAWRLSLQRFGRLQLHFFRGLAGVTVVYYEEEQDSWAAYATTRATGAPRPETYLLVATDAARARRTEIRRGGTFEIRWHAGELLLSRGDIVLLRAPCPQLPDEVYWQGKAAFHGVAAVRSLPPEPSEPAGEAKPAAAAATGEEPPTVVTFDTQRPADLTWTPKLGPGAQFTTGADGAVELTADKAERSGWLVTPLPQAGLQEVVLEVEQATPGTGIFLGRADGQPCEVMRFVRDRRTGRTCMTVRDDDSFELDLPAVGERTVPFVGPRLWIRLLYGCGSVRWSISADGVHWAAPEVPWGGRPSGVGFVGLHHVPKKEGCRIRLRRLMLRELPHLSALASAAAWARAVPLIDAPQLGIWVARVTELQPAEIPLDDWRRACALRTLGAGCPRELANALLGVLLEDAQRRGLPWDEQRALLDETTLLLDTRDDWAGLETLFQRYQQLGRRAMEGQGERPYSWVRRHALAVPLPTPHNVRPWREDTVGLELIQLATQQRWRDLALFCRQLRYFRQFDNVPLFAWAEATAFHNTARRSAGSTVAALNDDWRQLLIEEVSRETYNVVAELQALLASGSVEDAARLIATLEPGGPPGLAPSAQDRQLLVSLPAAVALTIQTRPDLQALLRERFARAADLRVQQAIRDGNVAALQWATVQYAGGAAAADAHRWLGDRALASGWFSAALDQYRRSARSAGAALRRELAPRARLAAALLGNELGKPITTDVKLGELALRATEFETLVTELLKRQPATAASAPTPSAAAKPTGFSVQRRSPLDGAVGREPTTEVVPNTRRCNVDWVDRQLGVAREGSLLYVSNRFQVAAYDLTNGQRKWQFQLPPETSLRAQDWGLIAMRPLVTPQRFFVRLLTQPNPQLTCLDKLTGQVVWTSEAVNNQALISDPVLVQGQLLCLTLAQPEPDENHLQLWAFDPDTGRLLRQQPLVRLQAVWTKRRCAEVTPLEDGLVAVLGGLTVCCDVDGQVRWLRQQTALPPGEEPQWVAQAFDRPLLAAGRLFVAQPGVRGVECLAADTGWRDWQVVLPGLQRIIGLAGTLLVVQTEEGLLALDAGTGKEQWRHPATDLLQAALSDDQHVIYTRRVPVEEGKPTLVPQVVWLAAASGDPVAVTRLAGLEDPDPRLGPLVPYQDRLWTFFGRGHDQATREVVECVSQGEAQKPEPDPRRLEVWMRHMPVRQVAAIAQKVGPWRLLGGEAAGPQPVEAERWGRRDVPGTRCRSGLPIILSRRLNIPAEGQTRLRLIVGSEPAQEWQLQVRAGGAPVLSRDLTAATDPQPWKTIEVDLSPHAGQTLWVNVEAHFLRGGDHADLYWDTVEMVTR